MLATSFLRRLVVMIGAALAFVVLYEVTMLDSKHALRQARLREAGTRPALGRRLSFSATAYCKGGITASGVATRPGIAAADPALLAVGSVVQVDAGSARYSGIYTVMDTGSEVRGREVDLYMRNCEEALAFGRQDVTITVLRLGWSPAATTPALADFLFRRRPSIPSRPIEAGGLARPVTPPAPRRLPGAPPARPQP